MIGSVPKISATVVACRQLRPVDERDLVQEDPDDRARRDEEDVAPAERGRSARAPT